MSAGYARVRALFEALVDRDPAAREQALAAVDDPALVAEVRALLQDRAPDDGRVADRIARAAARALDDDPTPPGTMLGPYRVERELGRGGMGRVLLAARDDGAFRQRVAIKLIAGLASAADRVRLLRERQVLADLDHPGITRLIDGGSTAQGEPYLVMEYVEGRLLPDWLDATRPDLAARLRLVERLAEATHYAHQHQVIHCDIKPANVIVRAEHALAVVEQDAHEIAGVLGHGHVEIAVEVAQRRVIGVAAAVAEQHDRVVAVAIHHDPVDEGIVVHQAVGNAVRPRAVGAGRGRHGDVELAVAVEVGDGGRHRRTADVETAVAALAGSAPETAGRTRGSVAIGTACALRKAHSWIWIGVFAST